MKFFALRFLFCAFVATAFSLSAVAQSVSGEIRAVKVDGEAFKISASGATTPLKSGDRVAETDTVTTGKGAGVILSFANGSTVKLGPDSRLAVEEFKIDPFEQAVKVSELKGEPSVSKTSLNLSYGEMVGDVKKLNGASQYRIKTPVGAAGIRGTIYRIVFRPASDGKAFFTVQTAEGRVVMEGVTAGEVPVEAGKEVVVEVDTANPTTPVVRTQDISPSSLDVITGEARSITTAVADQSVTPPGDAPSNSQQTDQGNQVVPPADNTKPPTAPPPPPLTPGSGL